MILEDKLWYEAIFKQKQTGKDPPAQLIPGMMFSTMGPKPDNEEGKGGNRPNHNPTELEEMARVIQALMWGKILMVKRTQLELYKTETNDTTQECDIFVIKGKCLVTI